MSKMTGHPESTIRNFMSRYNKNPTLEIKRGRPVKITDNIKQGIVSKYTITPESTLKDGAEIFGLCEASIKKALNEENIYYFQKIPVPFLTDLHRMNRIIFSRYITGFPPDQPPPIIITDESTVMVDLEKGGIWRKRGFFPPWSFYTLDKHATSVMVWGGELGQMDTKQSSSVVQNG